MMIRNTFRIPIIPENDEERLKKLYGYQSCKEFHESGNFKHIATMAAHIFKAPIALVSFVDKDYVIFKGNVGMEDTEKIERGISLCSLAILNDEPTVFYDAKKEACLMANPLVAGEFGLQFYAGAPIITHDGYNIGTVCIVDKKARNFSENDQYLLEGLASAVVDELQAWQRQNS